ncbi:hypothetical protein G3I60_00730 [Streptomyces sp. SID13666]|uniref:hypothetical protein n=1 Tax=Streptomyces TaxID=1883 RepID=UPI0013C29A8F|nr:MULTISPECIES: hypothetical protein [Streptomyces]MCZ4095066.1 hypothetical protein [Streptomyces sp. H39-C1]NEA52736.1 hypothetical protein [Streptomyces sp. SID13666]NEA69937.1 hypothetical protein [Streptomyces sp. SID13588]
MADIIDHGRSGPEPRHRPASDRLLVRGPGGAARPVLVLVLETVALDVEAIRGTTNTS